MTRIALLLPITLIFPIAACDDDSAGGGTFDFAFPPRDLSGLVPDDLSRVVDGGQAATDLAGRDLSTGADLAAGADLAPRPDLAGACGVVVNEVQIGSAVGVADEMVELFNSCARSITLAGNTVLVARALGDPTTIELQDLAGVTIPAGGYRLFTNTSYAGLGASDGVFPIAGADLLTGNGAVAIAARRGAAYDVLDAVAWGAGGGAGAPAEGATRPAAPADGKTLARLPNGADSDDNGADFSSAAAPTPRAANAR
jgi:hypothetical protein